MTFVIFYESASLFYIYVLIKSTYITMHIVEIHKYSTKPI